MNLQFFNFFVDFLPSIKTCRWKLQQKMSFRMYMPIFVPIDGGHIPHQIFEGAIAPPSISKFWALPPSKIWILRPCPPDN